MIDISALELQTQAEVDAHLRAHRGQLVVKRVLDVVLGSLLLLVVSPLLIVAMLLIRIDSPGPVLFSQERWGWRERRFRCYKLRTMHIGGAPASQPGVNDGVLPKLQSDPRVFRSGRWLRKSSIDELPQLWNVVRGDMSLVGPRPLMLHMLQPYPAFRAIRCKLRPGITGLWQVNDRANNTHAAHMARWDLDYIQNVSLVLDLRLLARTIGAVFTGRGAV